MAIQAFATGGVNATPLHILNPTMLDGWKATADEPARRFVQAQGFLARPGQIALVPDRDGTIAEALVGWPETPPRERFGLAAAAQGLPPGDYALATVPEGLDREGEALGWLLGSYRFDRYATRPMPEARLRPPQDVDAARLETIATACALAMDLINTPANDMGPAALQAAIEALGAEFDAQVDVTTGDALEAGFPLVATVGRAAAQAPRLIDLTWGAADAPKVTLVGKGVCFDTGGLNLKPGASMGLMKKDMGGAANAIALARMVMALDLPVRLRLLVPAVENAVGAGAFRPGDILGSRKGLSIEVNNTDAEGRLVLADALALADEEAPRTILCMATLTGAARVALGPDVPPFFTDDETLAAALTAASARVSDPLWRLPFHLPYEAMIEPGIADLDNAPSGGMAGAITAALFLRRFVEKAERFAHFDLYGWTPSDKPGRPKGGAAQGIRAMLDVIEKGGG
ncbi:MAG: leucyl aminopeptidase family protein [Rubricella sp.]